jgi:hypothetical protein
MSAASNGFYGSSVRELSSYPNYSDSTDSDDLYDEVDMDTGRGTANTITLPEGNPLQAASPCTIPLAASSSSTLATLAPSVLLTPAPATIISSNPLAETASEKENHGIHGTELGSTDNNATGTTGLGQGLVLTLPGRSPLPLQVMDNGSAGQRQSSAKRMKQ